MATGKPSSPGSLVGQASRLPTGQVVTDVQARRPQHKDSGCLVAQPSRLHAMGRRESEINPNEGGHNKQGGIK